MISLSFSAQKFILISHRNLHVLAFRSHQFIRFLFFFYNCLSIFPKILVSSHSLFTFLFCISSSSSSSSSSSLEKTTHQSTDSKNKKVLICDVRKRQKTFSHQSFISFFLCIAIKTLDFISRNIITIISLYLKTRTFTTNLRNIADLHTKIQTNIPIVDTNK